MKSYFIGVDLGTSGIKAGVIDSDGVIHAQAYWDTEITSDGPGRMAQDPDFFYHSTLKIIKVVVEKAGLGPSDIDGITIDGQMGGIIGIDRQWRPITGLDMGLDIQSERYNDLLHREAGKTLAALSCGSPRNTPKMMMWKREHPDIYNRIEKFVTLSGYVAGKIINLDSSDAFIDYTLLSFFGNEDAINLGWSSELTGIADLDFVKLPRIHNPWDIVGKMSADSAAEAGLTPGVPLMAGAGDQPAGNLGIDLNKPGRLLDVSGSTTLLFCSTDAFRPDEKNRAVMYMPSVIKGKYTAFTYINGGGISLKWFRDEFASGITWEELSERCGALPPGAENLMFIPYMGGRQCPYNARMRGSWLGLNWGHKKEHMFRAILEGLGFDYALGIESIQALFPEYRFEMMDGTGGGTKNPLWNQIKSDILNITYNSLSDYQFSLRGCGIITGYGLGIYTDMEKAAFQLNTENEWTSYTPDPEKAIAYSRLRDIFNTALTSSISDTMSRLYNP